MYVTYADLIQIGMFIVALVISVKLEFICPKLILSSIQIYKQFSSTDICCTLYLPYGTNGNLISSTFPYAN